MRVCVGLLDDKYVLADFDSTVIECEIVDKETLIRNIEVGKESREIYVSTHIVNDGKLESIMEYPITTKIEDIYIKYKREVYITELGGREHTILRKLSTQEISEIKDRVPLEIQEYSEDIIKQWLIEDRYIAYAFEEDSSGRVSIYLMGEKDHKKHSILEVDLKAHINKKNVYVRNLSVIDNRLVGVEELVSVSELDVKAVYYDKVKRIAYIARSGISRYPQLEMKSFDEVNIEELTNGIYCELIQEDLATLGDRPKADCPICKGLGYYLSDIGLKLECSCVHKQIQPKKDRNNFKFHTNRVEEDSAVAVGLIPNERKSDRYDSQFIRNRIYNKDFLYSTSSKIRLGVRGFDKYIATLNEIYSAIISGNKLNCSYLIGASNGFGKTSFVIDCLKILHSKNKRAVPYMTLYELATLRKKYDYYLSGKSKENYRVDEERNRLYSFDDCVNCEVLFTRLSGIEVAKVEMNMLKTILNLRAIKGLPTVVFMEEPLRIYQTDSVMNLYVWDEILVYKDEYRAYDKVKHVATFKVIEQNENYNIDKDVDL